MQDKADETERPRNLAGHHRRQHESETGIPESLRHFVRGEKYGWHLASRIRMCSITSVENSAIELCAACPRGRSGVLQGVAKSAHV